MSRYVLCAHIGPVQDMIASARRCRDLWFGSFILSELAKAAALAIVHEPSTATPPLHTLVFPYVEHIQDLHPNSSLIAPNKLVALVDADDTHVTQIAKRAEEGLHNRRDALMKQAFDRLDTRYFFRENAELQVKELFEFLWAASIQHGDDYALARKQANWLLSAKKNARTFTQPSPAWAKPGVPKSSLDGERESVLHEDIFDAPIVTPPISPHPRTSFDANKRRTLYGVHGSERLCGVGLLKRWGGPEKYASNAVLSTPHLAALPLGLGIAKDAEEDPTLAREIKQALDALFRAVPSAKQTLARGGIQAFWENLDLSILQESTIREASEEQGNPRGSIKENAALQCLSRLLHIAKRPAPSGYYAVLVADGDGIGARLDQMTTPEEHRDFSKKLSAFAKQAPEIVKRHDGSLIYSGGDDVLALLPLHEAVECAAELAQAFAHHTGRTLSAGLAISHYLKDLGTTLALAREAETLAKESAGKNSLALAWDKRSGETTFVCDAWDALPTRLATLISLHEAEAIPDRIGYELTQLQNLRLDPKIQEAEALRILRRKQARRGQEKMAEEHRDKLKAWLGKGLSSLGDEISVAAWLAKAKQQAKPLKEQQA